MKKEVRIEKSKSKKNGGVAYSILSLFFMAAICIALEILSIYFAKLPLIKRYATVFVFSCIFITISLLGVAVWGILLGKERVYKGLFSAFIVLIVFLAILFLIIKTDFIAILQTPELYQKFLEKTGAWMPILYILLQLLQVVLLPIPSVVSTLAGVALFGALKATIFSFTGIFIGSFLGFFIGRKFGGKAVAWLVGEEELKKWLKKLKGKDLLILTIMFILPLFPDDILCFIAGLSTMSCAYFLIMCAISRLIGITATCYSFEFIPFNTWWGIAVWAIIFTAFLFIFFVVYKNIDTIYQFLKRITRKRTRK